MADRVRQFERLKAEKVRTSKFTKKKVAYVEMENIGNSSDSEYEYVEENEVNRAELKSRSPYTYKLLKPSNRKNPVEPKNENLSSRTYTFDVTKSDEIFDLLVIDEQIVIPKGTKVHPFEQRKKKVFCKFHNFWGHNTSQCVLLRGFIAYALEWLATKRGLFHLCLSAS